MREVPAIGGQLVDLLCAQNCRHVGAFRFQQGHLVHDVHRLRDCARLKGSVKRGNGVDRNIHFRNDALEPLRLDLDLVMPGDQGPFIVAPGSIRLRGIDHVPIRIGNGHFGVCYGAAGRVNDRPANAAVNRLGAGR